MDELKGMTIRVGFTLMFSFLVFLVGCTSQTIIIEPPRDVDIQGSKVGSEFYDGQKSEGSVSIKPENSDNQSSSLNSANNSSNSNTFQRQLESYAIGQSANGTPIYVTSIGSGNRGVVLVGGMHAGFAPGSVDLAKGLVDYFSENPNLIPNNITLYIISNANPDSTRGGVESKSGRVNGNDVDINRNWDCGWTSNAVWRDVPIGAGQYPFSEPETKALRDFFSRVQPKAVIFFEAKGRLIAPGTCNRSSISQRLAGVYGDAAGYKVGAITGYRVTGDSSDWLDSQGIPAVAVLLPNYTSTDWSNNLKGVLAVLGYIS